jgi:hypothetical protein
MSQDSKGGPYDPIAAMKQLEGLDGLLPRVQTPEHLEKFQKVQVG